jgi:hypothetical protein
LAGIEIGIVEIEIGHACPPSLIGSSITRRYDGFRALLRQNANPMARKLETFTTQARTGTHLRLV